MKNYVLAFCLLASAIVTAQDTLNCKEHLTWDKTGKFYYKTGDESKEKYTGPAKCFPRKGVENRGYLKNGSWEGKVFGYQEGRLIGVSNFDGGFYDGPTVRYNEKGLVKDSIIYRHGTNIYQKKMWYDNMGMLSEAHVVRVKSDTLIIEDYEYDEGYPTGLEIQSFYKKKKNGAFETRYYEELADGTKGYVPVRITFYKDGVKTSERSYDGGYLYVEDVYENGKKVLENMYEGDLGKLVQQTPYRSGKIHGEVKYYHSETKNLYQVEVYENGKLIETRDVK
ncbi:MAG: hypothetical protein K0R65_1286 [Crocinitomicaceae bacterium]|jgi:antitoxin component YwqK of YwqJK toxin-antitoxin module|nr:hypothetical protein [Crocinitomicaceae bacterium]